VFSAHAYLLPYLEQENLKNRIDYNSAPTTYSVANGPTYDGSANFEAARTVVKVFLCPADVGGGRVPGSQYAATSYAANSGSGTVDVGTLANADGVFFLGSTVGFRDITDGTSNTAAFSERTLGTGSAGGDTQRLILERPPGSNPTVSDCAAGSGGWFASRGEKWIFGNYGYTIYNHYYPPNSPSWDCMNVQQQKALATARGRHPGGVMVLFCDGGVRFVPNAIDFSIWRALATRAGGEVSSDW
jgi:prepilin-type processing-associated H-X9-DG protein